MKTEIKLLCPECKSKIEEHYKFGYLITKREGCGYCDECGCDTGHLQVVEILKEE